MAEYKLTYFNVKGVSEPIRYIFAYCDVPFEDNRIEKENWPALKQNQPYGQLPVLDTGDAFLLTQSVAIARFLGRKFNLMGRDDVHNAMLDSIVDHMQELHWKLYAIIRSLDTPSEMFAKGAAPPKVNPMTEFENDVLPFYLTKFNTLAAEGYFLGNSPTWADVYFVGWLDTMETRLKNEILGPYPNLIKIRRTIQEKESVQKYLEKRPFTTM